MEQLLKSLKKAYPNINFVPGKAFFWSPANQTVTYPGQANDDSAHVWALLHEVGHAVASHTVYKTDLELLMMEVAAWEEAKRLAGLNGLKIDEEHIQDCLDTYRDWLDHRSTCPICGNTGLQVSPREYQCFNCQTHWQVSASRFCRPYRQLNRDKKKTPPRENPKAVFK